MVEIEELWSKRDEEQLHALRGAAPKGDYAGALFAIEGAEELAQLSAARQLEAWGAQTRARLEGGLFPATPEGQARALADVLSVQDGLIGDRDDYHAIQNSQFTQVIARRRGLPILLSLIWVEVGRRAGVEVTGVGMPAHFLARVGGAGGVLVDPFAGGKLLTVDDCRKILRELSGGQTPWSDTYLTPSPPLLVLERVLRNLVNAYGQQGDQVEMFRIVSLLCGLRPEAPLAHLQRAELAEELGADALAAAAYGDVARRFAGTREAAIAAGKIRQQKPQVLQ